MKKNKNSSYITDGVLILDELFVRGDPEMEDLLKIEREKANVAQKIYDLRNQAELTQKQLAELVGTTPSVISRLENADDDGHSMRMLKRIAEALGRRVKIEFPRKEKPIN